LDFSANREARGTLVVHCGNPTIGDEEFPGFVLVLDEPSRPDLCGGRSRYRSEGANVRGYVYAESTAANAAIYLDGASRVSALPSEEGDLLAQAFSTTRLQSWRDLYR
jgi:hypothetical protein